MINNLNKLLILCKRQIQMNLKLFCKLSLLCFYFAYNDYKDIKQIDKQSVSWKDRNYKEGLKSLQRDNQKERLLSRKIVSQKDSQIERFQDRKVTRQNDKQIARQKDTQKERQVGRLLDSQTAIQLHSQRAKQKDSQIAIQIDSQIAIQIASQIETNWDICVVN